MPVAQRLDVALAPTFRDVEAVRALLEEAMRTPKATQQGLLGAQRPRLLPRVGAVVLWLGECRSAPLRFKKKTES